MKDIAEKLGISASTVSRALNDRENTRLSREQVERIRAMAHKMGYVNDITAASLRTQRTYTVGIVVPDILNPVFPPIIKGAQQRLAREGYVSFVLYSENSHHIAQEEVKKLVGRRVDGIIYASAFLEDAAVEYCIEQETPLVLVNRSISDGDRVHQVLDDDRYGIDQAIDYLYSIGHRSLVHLSGPQDILHGVERLDAFLNKCQTLGMQCEAIAVEEFTLASGRYGAREMLKQESKATGIIAGNDLIAIGAMQELSAQGRRVPEDISVIGFNGMPLSDAIKPPLTTVSIAHSQLGENAAKLLLNELENPGQRRKKILLKPELIVRESTSAIE